MRRKPIAIVGMACRLPGANDLDEFWNLLVQRRNAIAPIPEDRLNRRLYYDPKVGTIGRTYSDKGALVDYSDAATPGGCITEDDIRNYDAAHITLCRVADQAIVHSGQALGTFQEHRTGVYFGHAASSGLGSAYAYAACIPQIADYLRDVSALNALSPQLREQAMAHLTSTVRSLHPWRTHRQNPRLTASDAAQLIAAKFRLNGPCMVFNSACASSLQAIAHAMKSLQLGHIDTAVAGGASYLHSDTLVLFSAAQSLSADGSYPFAQAANGLIAGEGYVVFILKTLEKAVADGDRVYAVLPGVGISSDGKGKSLWAPSPDGQTYAMSRAYADPADFANIEYIEGHFTSTHLGDKTEIQSITRLLQERQMPKKRIPVGSVKGNVGHCLEVAGAVGLLKVVLALQHDLIPAAVDPGMPLNKDVDWKNIPVFPPSANLPWRPHVDGTSRRSGVNAFGIGGLNVHLAVEDAPRHQAHAASIRTSVATGSPRHEAESVAIVGTGMILPGALNFSAFREMLKSRVSGIRPVPKKPWDAPLFSDRSRWGDQTIPMPGGGIVENFEYDWKKHGIPPKQLRQASPLQFMILEAVDQALTDANYDLQNTDLRTATGCVVGTSFGGDFATQLTMGLRQPETGEILSQFLVQNGCTEQEAKAAAAEFYQTVLKQLPALIDETGSFTSSALASRITKSFDLKGGGVAVEASDVSALSALTCCMDALLTYANDVMICVAGQHDLTPGVFHEMALIDRIAELDNLTAPYDARSQGTLPGEGCVVFILKRLSDAQKAGDRILGIIRGVGAAKNDSIQQAVQDAVTQAREMSGVTGDKTAAISLVGLGMSEIDQKELKTLDANFVRTRAGIPAMTTVGQFGHLGAASGFVALLAGLVALDELIVHPTLAFTHSAEELELNNLVLDHTPQKITNFDAEGNLYVSLNNCSEFGNTYHMILQRGTPVKPEVYSASSSHVLSDGVEQVSSHVFHFDATVRRKERLRSGMVKPSPVSAFDGKVAEEVKPQTNVSIPAWPSVATQPSPVVTPVTPVAVSSKPSLDPSEIQNVLVEWVASHTGYPTEIIDLDEHLREGLGLDDAMVGMLLGELAPSYGVAFRSSGDFATLRQVLDFLVANGTQAGSTPVPISSPAPQSAVPATPVIPAASVTPAAAPATTTGTSTLDAKELEAFLVKFVVDQTGYPEEHVTLDVDLEDTLSIDSIKKAQLFGELGEFFDIRVSGDVTLDDFTTLRHVLDFLLANGTQSDSTPTPASNPAPQSAVPATPVTPAVAPAATTGTSTLDAKELEAFLVKFVVDQTGYPEEHVTLDVDLEDTLSIDSIKKAQLFGELGEFFDIRVSGDVTLDDFTTLRHVLDFIMNNSK